MNNKMNYLEIVILILASFSPLLSQPIKAGLILLLILVNYKYLITLNKRKVFVLVVFISIFLVALVLDLKNISSLSDFSILNVFFPMCFVLGYIISEKYRLNELFHILDRVTFIFVLFSIIGVFVYTFIPNIVGNLPSYHYYHTSHKTALIFNILTNSSTGVLKRNAGIAWEPGAFQFLVNLGLYSYLRTTNKVSLLRIALYSLAVITTQSTAGILIFLVITFKLFLQDKKARVLVIVSILLFGGIIIEELIYQFQYKLFGSYAFQARLNPLLNAFEQGKYYFFGIGNSGFDIFYRVSNQYPWDSFGQIFIRYGYPLFIFIAFRLSKLIKKQMTLFIILFITFSSQNIWFFPLITPFYYYFPKKDGR